MAEKTAEVLQAIDRLYGDILEDGDWTRALRAVQEVLGCACVCVALRDHHTGESAQHTSRGAAEATGDRLVPGCSVDPDFKISSVEKIPVRSAADRGKPGLNDSIRFFHWHCEPDRCSFCLGAPLPAEADVSGVAAAHWPQMAVDAQREHRRVLQVLLPHIARAVVLDKHQAGLREDAAGSAFLMDRVAQAVLVLDARGQVLRANQRASRLLDRGAGLKIVDGCLQAEHEDASHKLQALIREVVDAGTAGDGASLTLVRDNGGPALRLMIEALHPGRPPPPGRAAVVIIVGTSESGALLSWRPLMSLYGLTRNEARLAARLGDGASLAEAAEDLRISYRTASVHLQHVLRKTATHRQSELVRLLLLSPAIIAESPEKS